MTMSPLASRPLSSTIVSSVIVAGRQHHPDRARRRQLLDEIGEVAAAAWRLRRRTRAPCRRSCRRRRSCDRSASAGARCCRPCGRARSFRVASKPGLPAVLPARLCQSLFDRASERGEAGVDDCRDATRKARRPRSASTSKSPRACAALTTPNVYFWPGTGRSCGVVAGDLQEDAAVRAALVGLPGRVQEARAEAETGRDLLVRSRTPRAQRLQRRDMRRGCARCRRAARHSRRRRCGRDAP